MSAMCQLYVHIKLALVSIFPTEANTAHTRTDMHSYKQQAGKRNKIKVPIVLRNTVISGAKRKENCESFTRTRG